MTTKGGKAAGQGYETTRPGTIYWTLSLYIDADKVAEALKGEAGKRVEPDVFSRVQRAHLPSLALRNAIDPLMNDIADRETQGRVQEFLLAAGDEDAAVADMNAAAVLIRRHKDLVFRMPESVSWTTEGVKVRASPPGLADDRQVRLRRYWLSHNNGALSYHLAFSHYYGGEGEAPQGYTPSTYYFLSMLQKLAAPKEYALDPGLLERLTGKPDGYVDVFCDTVLNIDPLDKIMVQSLADGQPVGEERRFWPFVKEMFEGDALRLFGKLAPAVKPGLALDAGFETRLLELTPFMEVPGLKVPKSRFMFMLHDERFFDRLMPLDVETGEMAPRKRMVQQGCYDPYQKRVRALIEGAGDHEDGAVHLDLDYWDWVCGRADYDKALAAGAFVREAPDGKAAVRKTVLNDADELVAAMRAGECVQNHDLEGEALAAPLRHDLPAFEKKRADCLDYLFLAGFNQNIIDFMNQDTSEILDSIDPIYPDSSDQSDERFFVRYANHRAMITYVPASRSLEIGNDYIGACPYAFLIHALALHNEFLARTHEEKSMLRIDRIEAWVLEREPTQTQAMIALQDREAIDGDDFFDKAQMAINQAKLAEFSEYDRYRYTNPFRYDTERDVFESLEQLRGISRKKEALTMAIASLEDHASDLQRRHQKQTDAASAKRGLWLNILLGGTGVFGAGQMIYWIGEKAAGGVETDESGAVLEPPKAVFILFHKMQASSRVGEVILWWTEIFMTFAAAIFIPLLLWILFDTARHWLASERKRLMLPEYAAPRSSSPLSRLLGGGWRWLLRVGPRPSRPDRGQEHKGT